MRTLLTLAALALAVTCSGCQPNPSSNAMSYPTPRKNAIVETLHGTTVADPYRWMEDLDSPEVAEWVTASNELTDAYLSTLPLRRHFNERLTELWNYPRVSVPVTAGGRLFYTRNAGLQRQAPVFMRVNATSEPVLILDPNAISEDGSVSISGWTPSPDATLLAYGLSEGGADWQTIRVRNIATGEDLADEVRWMRFSTISWTNDSKGFFYSRYPEPPDGEVLEAALSRHAIYYHRLGTPQSQDTLVYERPDLTDRVINGSVTEDGRYLLVAMFQGASNENRLYYADLGNPNAPSIDAPIRPVVEADDAEYAPVGSQDSTVFLRTDKDTPNRKIVAVDLRNPAPSSWRTVVEERQQPLESAELVGGRLVCQYLVDVQSRLLLFDLDGSARGEIELPGAGAVGEIRGREDAPAIWYSFSSPLEPSTVYVFDPGAGTNTPFDPPTAPVETVTYETQAMFATSRDGTRVPFFLSSKKNIPLDGNNPTMLYGYGGFSISTLPTYRQDVPAWLERGGIWVTANMRGGAEYGEAWHRAGMLEKKQNVFDDFLAVAEHLVRERFTSPARLGIMGRSNGGLLVAAAMEQRPDLFAVALPAVGVLDMLRYDRFTGGKLWAVEYGSASNPDQFPFLIKYSPLHNVKPGTCYPATLITTADHDDRVVPSHSFKFAATLQEAQGCDKPVLIRVEVQGSHGYRPTDRLIAERADEWAFAATNLGMR